jgi:pyruvate/2-oxoglutarate dehydrogenase complex dihydrolipoamide dehydrogenase (E3) component
MAVGSIPNTENLGLEERRRGARPRAASSRSTACRAPRRGVYAAGDCTGVLMLASVAAMQGRIAMWHALGDAVTPARPRRPCRANVFTDPEIATVGVTQARGRPGDVVALSVKLPLATNARAKMQGIWRRLREAVRRPGTGIIVGGSRGGAAGERARLPDHVAIEHGSPSTSSRTPSPSTRRSPARSPRPPASCTRPTDQHRVAGERQSNVGSTVRVRLSS